ncbi:MAG: cytochrome C [Syntrophobacteraceae bacterium]
MKKGKPKTRRGTAALSALLCFCFAMGGAAGPPDMAVAAQAVSAENLAIPIPGSPAIPDDYVVFAFNDLGMHCYDADYSVYSILPPFNVLHAQVIRRGVKPQFVPYRNLTVRYSAQRDAGLSINTTSIGKSNFWDYSLKLYGVSLLPDMGLLGQAMPGSADRSIAFLSYDTTKKWYSATGIPLTDVDDAGVKNHTPLMRVDITAPGAAQPLASISAVAPVSSEMHCFDCHQTGSDGASDALMATYGIAAWSTSPDMQIQFRENILTLHDAINKTNLMASRPVLCASCHYSYALDLSRSGPQGQQIGKSVLSLAVHRHHGKTTAHTLPDPLNPPIVPEEGSSTCYNCHPGKETKCLRGVMSVAGINCQNCHGGMLAVGGVYPLKTTHKPRRPWVDLPKCQSCHTGDALRNNGGQIQPILRIAYDLADPSATPRKAVNARFIENLNTRFRDSKTHYGIACEACHGSPHAEWPAAASAVNDNTAPIQLQGYEGPVRECSVCHTAPMQPGLGGPHNLHNVNDPNWTQQHKTFYAENDSECRACHGRSLEGTRLSKTAIDRVSYTILSNRIEIPTGTPVQCGMCHKNPRAR